MSRDTGNFLGPHVDIVKLTEGLSHYLTDLLACFRDILPPSISAQCRKDGNDYDAARRIVDHASSGASPELEAQLRRFIEQNSALQSLLSSSRSFNQILPAWEIPSEPAIFYGREDCIKRSTEFLLSPRQRELGYKNAVLTIRGEAGIGKSTASRAVLTHQGVMNTFAERRSLIACDAVESVEALESVLLDIFDLSVARGSTIPGSTTISAAFGQRARTPNRKLLGGFLRTAPALLALDNFESVYNGSSDQQVAELVDELAANCSLVLTIRGGIPPMTLCENMRVDLRPLPAALAKCAFLDFAKLHGEARLQAKKDPILDELLGRLDGHPLSVALLGYQVQAGCDLPDLLGRYKALLAATTSRRGCPASLSASISVSLNMSVLRETQGALKLCCLMARLPDGAENQAIETILASDAATIPPASAEHDFEAANRELVDLAVEARIACFEAGLIAQSDELQRWRMLAPISEFIAGAVTNEHPPFKETRLSFADIDSRILEFYHERLASVAERSVEELQRLPFPLHHDLRNIDQVIIRALRSPQPPRLLKTLEYLCEYLLMTAPSHVQCVSVALERTYAGRRLLENANYSCENVQDRSDMANCLKSLGELALCQGHHNEGQGLLEEAKGLHDKMKAWNGKANCSWSLGDLDVRQGRCGEGKRLLEEARGLYDKVGNRLGRANCLNSLGALEVQQDRHEEGRALLQEAGELYDKLENRLGKANNLRNLGSLEIRRDCCNEGRRLLEEARGLYDGVGSKLGLADCLNSLGDLEVRQDYHDEGRKLLKEAGELYDKMENRLGKANSLWSRGDLAILQGRYDDSQHLLGGARRLYDKIGYRLGKTNCLRRLGDLRIRQDCYEEGRKLLQTAVDLYDELEDRLGKANSLQSLGDLAILQGHHDEGKGLLDEAYGLYDGLKYRIGKATCRRRLGDLAIQQGRHDEGRNLLVEACQLCDEAIYRRGKVNSLQSLSMLNGESVWGAIPT